MRFKIVFPLLLPLFLAVLLAGCVTEDIKETGISRGTAIGIAERHCPEYPDTYSLDRAEWDPDGKFWLVVLDDRDGDRGRAFKISRGGDIIDAHKFDHSDQDRDYGPGHYYGWGYYW